MSVDVGPCSAYAWLHARVPTPQFYPRSDRTRSSSDEGVVVLRGCGSDDCSSAASWPPLPTSFGHLRAKLLHCSVAEALNLMCISGLRLRACAMECSDFARDVADACYPACSLGCRVAPLACCG